MKIFEAIKWALLGAEFALIVVAIVYKNPFISASAFCLAMFVLGANIQKAIIATSEEKKKKEEIERFIESSKKDWVKITFDNERMTVAE